MKKLLFAVMLPLAVWSTTLVDVLKGVDNNLLLKSKSKEVKALEQMVKVAKSKDYPTVDLSLNAFRLKDTPTTLFVFPPFPPVTIPLGTKDNVNLEIGFVYPIFSGYAITNSIKKSKLELIKAKLQKENLKRELYLKAISLYGAIYATTHAIEASKEALKSADEALKKAKELYKNDLLNIAAVYNIEAKKFQIKSSIKRLVAKRDSLSNDLAYLSGLSIKEGLRLDNFLKDLDEGSCIARALRDRKDIKAIKEQLNITEYDIKLAKSRYYPSVALVGAIKRQGDNFRLNGNGYTNADSSYIGVSFKWNLFDGFAKDHQKEAAMRKKEATALYLIDYEKKVTTDIKNAFLKLSSLESMLKASNKELLSQKEYFRLTKGRFENELASADELSRAISSLAMANAKLKEIEAEIFVQKNMILLMSGLESMQKVIE